MFVNEHVLVGGGAIVQDNGKDFPFIEIYYLDEDGEESSFLITLPGAKALMIDIRNEVDELIKEAS